MTLGDLRLVEPTNTVESCLVFSMGMVFWVAETPLKVTGLAFDFVSESMMQDYFEVVSPPSEVRFYPLLPQPPTAFGTRVSWYN